MSLGQDDFPAFFQAVHGDAPFLWQQRLLREVVAQGWPDAIAAPTGAGKTAVLDVALFHLAMHTRTAPRRIVLAVDRRVVVDQAFQRARRLHGALRQPIDPVVARVAAALWAVSGGGEPLHVEELRGGMPREDDWARDPVQPTILCTTVDQLGSRLLFRGYGVSASMAPIHAGLLGEDALLLLDEAHLSGAFRDTLRGVQRRRGGGLGLPWTACMLTATPAVEETSVFALTAAERQEEAIRARLDAAKQAVLQEVTGQPGSAEHVAALAAAARMLLDKRPTTRTVAVVVNRVGLARAVFKALAPPEQDTTAPDCILLTGRVRPIARDALIADHAERLSGAADRSEGRPLFVVATQCIEAGADFSFDAMVTQIAPLDALQQRFGRLNRFGRRSYGDAVVAAASREVAAKAEDALYGDRLRTTWTWLKDRITARAAAGLDVSPNALQAAIDAAADAARMCRQAPGCAPLLRAADVDFLVATNPASHPDPCLSLFLHGAVEDSADVSIVWRADCSAPPRFGDVDTDRLTRDLVGAVRPRPGEALRVPVWAAQAWLAQRPAEAAAIPDVERAAAPDATERPGQFAFRWRGPDDDDSRWVAPQALRPGDTIIVPAAYGGCDRYGWAPDSTKPVADIAEQAAAAYGAAPVRLHPAVWQQAIQEEQENSDGTRARPWEQVWSDLATAAEAGVNQLQVLLDQADGTWLPEPLARAWAKLRDAGRWERLFPYGSRDDLPIGVVLVPARRRGTTEGRMGGSFAIRATPLDAHVTEVEKQVERMLGALPLAAEMAEAVRYAAAHHDDGKADLRFQRWLGAEPGDAPRAKSGRWRGLTVELAARARAGVPEQWRHEVLSVRLAAARLAAADSGFDRALALYLIGTHHGQGRPFFQHHDPWDHEPRPVLGTMLPAGPGPERLDFDWQGEDWPGLCISLRRRYGAWGLALLEALLRLADHRASEAGEST